MGVVIDATEKFHQRYIEGAITRKKKVMAALVTLVNSRPNMKEGVIALIRQEQERRRDK